MPLVAGPHVDVLNTMAAGAYIAHDGLARARDVQKRVRSKRWEVLPGWCPLKSNCFQYGLVTEHGCGHVSRIDTLAPFVNYSSVQV